MINIAQTTGSTHTPFFLSAGRDHWPLVESPSAWRHRVVKQHQLLVPAAEYASSQLKLCRTSLLPVYWAALIYDAFSPEARSSNCSRSIKNSRSLLSQVAGLFAQEIATLDPHSTSNQEYKGVNGHGRCLYLEICSCCM